MEASAMHHGPPLNAHESFNSSAVNRLPNIRLEENTETIQRADALLRKKKKKPGHEFSTIEKKVLLLRRCLDLGEKETEKLKDKEVIVVIGDTGVGKSTFINYVAGCEMSREDEKVIVKPKTKDESLDQIMAIGHGKKSKTHLPEIWAGNQGTWVDCPGFLDNRGLEINIANAVTIKRIFKNAKTAKVVVLIEYSNLTATRGVQIANIIRMCSNLFGSCENLVTHQPSILIGITKIPLASSSSKPFQKISNMMKKIIVEDHQKCVLKKWTKCIFIFDPEDKNLKYDGSLKREQILQKIKELVPLETPSSIFKTALTSSDLMGINDMCSQIEERIKNIFKKECVSQVDLKLAADYFLLISTLSILENRTVDKLIGDVRNVIIKYFQELRTDFDRAPFRQDVHTLPLMKDVLDKLKREISYFDETVKFIIDINEMEERYKNFANSFTSQKSSSPTFTQNNEDPFTILSNERQKFLAYCSDNKFVEARNCLNNINTLLIRFQNSPIINQFDTQKLTEFLMECERKKNEQQTQLLLQATKLVTDAATTMVRPPM